MIKIDNLVKRVTTSEGELVILKGVSLAVKTAETVAIVGASGSGKSTLLGLMAGLDTGTSGDVILNGHSLGALDEEQRAVLRGQLVGFVFQSFQLLPSLTALENVMLPIELKNDKNAHEKATQWLTRVGLGERGHHYPNQLSGGEQQRVAIARAFASEARILFADEPTGNLDSATGARVIDLLFSLNKEYATTLVLVTHDERLAHKCHRTIRLVAGEIVSDEMNAAAQETALEVEGALHD
ncbi:MAG: ABC transporter ATP-binding protein [Gammaproteobacteria bacterium]|nr:ABC transporter ATP-binding protein [Gammaproteobacteria bacterium]MDP2142382.1 ABC transporter ATP-binding protein [Gammaproteobacteria bacterium]MDP2348623.1 ABC transporter ATP-binding protein [Gammaproteobacteria bacterium]